MTDEKDTQSNILEKIRKGYSAKLKFKIAELELECRVLPAGEQYRIMGKVNTEIRKMPGVTQDKDSQDMRKSVEYQKAVLKAACTFGTESHVTDEFWNAQ